jgi:hypothetical protein
VPLTPQPDERRGRARSKVEEAEERAALELSRVDDDPAVEAELSSPPGRPPEDEDEWIEWAKSKLGPAEAAGAE